MRTLNPVSTVFSTLKNFGFFGYSQAAKSVDEFERRKKLRLDEAKQAIKDLHPVSIDVIPPCLCDPVSLGIISKAVITPYGTVYDETFLKQCLSRQQIDPSNRQPLTVAQIHPFPEFDELVREFSVKRIGLDALKRECLRTADDALSTNDTDIFLDPLSRQFILFPVMSIYGSVYDLQSIQRYFEQNRGVALIDPKTELPITEEQCKPFPEFKVRLDRFLRNMTDQGSRPVNETALSGTRYIDFITSADQTISDENLRNFFSLCNREELCATFDFDSLRKFMIAQNLSVDIKMTCLLFLETEGLLQLIIREAWKQDRKSNVSSFFSCSASESEKIYRDTQKVDMELSPKERLIKKLKSIGTCVNTQGEGSRPFSQLLKSIFPVELIQQFLQKLEQMQSENAAHTTMRTVK